VSEREREREKMHRILFTNLAPLRSSGSGMASASLLPSRAAAHHRIRLSQQRKWNSTGVPTDAPPVTTNAPAGGGAASDVTAKSKEEMAAKLKQALMEAAQKKKKPAAAPTSSQPSQASSAEGASSKASPQSSMGSGDASVLSSTAAATHASVAMKEAAQHAASSSQAASAQTAKTAIRRESTLERLGNTLKRAFTGEGSSGDVKMPPPNAVKVSPHLVNRARVTPARNLFNLAKDLSKSALLSTLQIPPLLFRAGKWMVNTTLRIAKDPSVIRTGSAKAWKSIKHEAAHYWTGFKVLGLELKTSSRLFAARLSGKELTRREKQQLQRTFTDVLRMGPFLVFVIVPFMEFTLPIFLKLFPNMLPSPFIDQKQKDLTRKNISQLRLEMASFMQEMVADVENKVRQQGADAKTVSALVEFVEKSRSNERIPSDIIPTLIKTFSDELTIERMSRENLQMMCRFMGVSTIGSDDFLRYSLLSRLRGIRADDAQIAWEGVDSLSLEELKQAALERGMIAESNDITHYRRQLARWIELSVEHKVSPAMLILSRAFAVAGPSEAPSMDPQAQVQHVLSSLEPEVVQDALVSAVDDVATSKEPQLDKAVLAKAKLESIKRENVLIEEDVQEAKGKKLQAISSDPTTPSGSPSREATNAASPGSPPTSAQSNNR